MLLPAVTYYVLEVLVARRQDWNMPMAVVALSAFVSLVVVGARVARRPGWLKLGAAFGSLLAIALWRLVPIAKWSRMF